jgi:deoxyribodipyrimidine photolyase-related protein
MTIRHLVLILGDQLNLDNPALEDFDPAQDRVLMVESSGEATHVWSHKARIVLFISAMRHFAEALVSNGTPLIYLKLCQHDFATLESAWQSVIAELKPQKIILCEPGEYRILKTIETLAALREIPLAVRDDGHFMISRADFKRWAGTSKSLRMEFFYRFMRKRHDVLMNKAVPEGGEWNYDQDNRRSFGKQGPQSTPEAPFFEYDDITKQVLLEVEQHYPNHPGSLTHFCWPVTRSQALKLLHDFINHKLAEFGPHQDAMWQSNLIETPFLWHSLLASSLNLKLLNPREVIAAAVEAYQTQYLPLASVEGFIRQILGWREFIRGVYWLDMPAMAEANHYQHLRPLPAWYWTGKTKMNCLAQTIKQTMQYGYAHHIQRLMVTGLFGLLAEINPREVEAWYLAVYVDAVEWVELPNVAGMALYANGGRFTSKPYVASGAYIKRMSNYCEGCRYKPEVKTGEDACPYTTLYWYFLIKHYEAFARNPRTALMAKNVARFSPDQMDEIEPAAALLLGNMEQI